MDKMVGERIRILREEKNYTREKFAEKVQVSSKFMYEIERKGKGFSADVLLRISKVLDVSCDYILLGEGAIEIEKKYLQELYDSDRLKKKYLKEILSVVREMSKQ